MCLFATPFLQAPPRFDALRATCPPVLCDPCGNFFCTNALLRSRSAVEPSSQLSPEYVFIPSYSVSRLAEPFRLKSFPALNPSLFQLDCPFNWLVLLNPFLSFSLYDIRSRDQFFPANQLSVSLPSISLFPPLVWFERSVFPQPRAGFL